MFVHPTNPNHKGNIAELRIAAEAAALGIGVLAPMTEHSRYDLVFDFGHRLVRVQCKWAPRVGDVVRVKSRCSYHSPTRGYVRSTYTSDEVDAIAAYCHDNRRCYLLPINEISGIGHISLRLSPARNGQLAGVRMAADYELGAVAQLEVAPAWHAGGRGFESPQLHSPAKAEGAVGAHLFRNHFGLYMQRAAAGETFNVTRRGKPYVQLSPAPIQPQLDAMGGEEEERGELPPPGPSSLHER